MAKGREKMFWIALTAALFLALSLGMTPAAQAVPYHTAPWTPLESSDGNGGVFHTAPWTPLSAPKGDDGLGETESTSAPDGNEGLSAPWTPLGGQDGNDGLGQTPAASARLLGDDITGFTTESGGAIGASVPEPATVLLLGSGILALMLIGLRRAISQRR